MPTTDEFLAHYGVKGMKWGVRKNRDNSPAARSARQEKAKNIAKVSAAATIAVGVTAASVILASKRGYYTPVDRFRDSPLYDLGKKAAQRSVHQSNAKVRAEAAGWTVTFL